MSIHVNPGTVPDTVHFPPELYHIRKKVYMGCLCLLRGEAGADASRCAGIHAGAL